MLEMFKMETGKTRRGLKKIGKGISNLERGLQKVINLVKKRQKFADKQKHRGEL